MNRKSEFSVVGLREYNRSGPVRWIISHCFEHKLYFFVGLVGFALTYTAFSGARVMFGRGAELIIEGGDAQAVIAVSLAVLILSVSDGLFSLLGSLVMVILSTRVERDSRHELYASLLGKSQTFHDQQRVGDIMARATDDVRQLNFVIHPGIMFIFDMVLGFAVPMIYIAAINLELLLTPIIFVICYVFVVRRYMRRLEPVMMQQRMQYGTLSARLEETISGIEIVKVAAQEIEERKKFRRNAWKFRDFFVEQGKIEAAYLPLLMFGIAFGFFFLHCLNMHGRGILSIGDIIAVAGLMQVLSFPVFISLFSISMIQLGLAGARRILELIEQRSDIDENLAGHRGAVDGAIEFENVTFKFHGSTVLEDVSFRVAPGQTVAIVGQTGSGKSTLTQLVSRTYDVDEGRVLIDGVDVRDWNLDRLRSQMGKIEQDIFLFSRSIADNISFGVENATREEIESAAKEAQAHDFIMSFNDGYDSEVGERGVTLSGGQRQRLALARAFLRQPRILILDDSTSAIDSATEDEIQKAMRRAQEGRTTILITHRLSQIRWADRIIVLENGRAIANGSHEELLLSSEHYRRIFARYGAVESPIGQLAAGGGA
ncbi:MAG: ABC transporter ATP-binding protein [Chloroflexota bacterium]|nr:ABC transporter ATP-binding protein [Chloroflexota bacterium]